MEGILIPLVKGVSGDAGGGLFSGSFCKGAAARGRLRISTSPSAVQTPLLMQERQALGR